MRPDRISFECQSFRFMTRSKQADVLIELLLYVSRVYAEPL